VVVGVGEADGAVEISRCLVAVEDPEGDRRPALGEGPVRGRPDEHGGHTLPAVMWVDPQRADEGLSSRGTRLAARGDHANRLIRPFVLERK
jgi:hypothetical protein